ncbi:ABC transporter ATP-binding protein [Chitinophaga niabensis]|uniref:ABC transporter ATP-binding protein n=1 Tax=Chitinophaga niabensis TaxID=536979 RepID=UPI0031B9FFBA
MLFNTSTKNIFKGQKRKLLFAAMWEYLHALFIAAPNVILLIIVRELFKPNPDPGKLWNTVYLLCGLIVFQFFVAAKSQIASLFLTADIGSSIRMKLGNHLRRISLGYFKKRDPGDIAAVLLQDVQTFEGVFGHSIGQLTNAIFGTSILVVVLFVLDWRLALALSVAIPLLYPFFSFTHKLGKIWGAKYIRIRNDVGNRFLEYLYGIRHIKSFRMTGEKFVTLDKALLDLRDESIKSVSLFSPLMLAGGVILELGFMGMAWLGAYYLLGGSITVQTVTAFLIIGYRLYEPIKIVLMQFPLLEMMGLSIKRVTELMETPTIVETGNKTPERFDISFEDVRFSYNETPVLQDITCRFPEKAMTALVGPSGSGKTTITNLIARFWDVNSGTIRIGNTDIRKIPQETWYNQISEVFQEVYLFDDSIYNNILIGKQDATETEVMVAAAKAQVLEFARQLPEGLHTKVGEGGSRLSGGQKQRISIARALLKNAPIVLLDEATASLDPENETYIQLAIAELVQDKTVIVIAHKLNTIRHAQQIIVLDDGSIREQGTHETLLQQNGLYARLWYTQQRTSGWKIVKYG